jgi:bacillithiol synthase
MPGQPDALAATSARPHAINFARFPWIRPLVTAYVNDFESVAPLFAGNPSDPSAWRDAIARVQRSQHDRTAIVAILERQLAARQAPARAREAAARLSDTSSVAILTGQQAGLFGGPLYTLLKAVTAIQVARRLEAEHGVPAVALFWVEAEDHDWAEVRSAKILDAGFNVQSITLEDPDGAGERPVGALLLDEGVNAALLSLRSALAQTEFTEETLTALGRSYRPGASMSAAFAGWLDTLLGQHGLVVYESSDPAAKPLVAPLFERELVNPCRTARLARDAGDAMAKLGHEPQVEPSEDGVALFYLDGRTRRAIKMAKRQYVIGGETYEGDALRTEAKQHPERFSPNVLLRPVVQDRLFPTVCYVAGPSELAYQAQLGGIYREFGVEPPLLYSRVSATLLDSAAMRFLERSRVPFEALHAQDESALNRLLESLLPPDVDRALEETERQIVARAEALRRSVSSIDATLSGAVDTTVDRMRDTLKSLHTKIISATKRKDETLRRQFQRTRGLAFPGGQPQERTLSVPFFVNRYGTTLCARLLETLPLDTDKHYVLTL